MICIEFSKNPRAGTPTAMSGANSRLLFTELGPKNASFHQARARWTVPDIDSIEKTQEKYYQKKKSSVQLICVEKAIDARENVWKEAKGDQNTRNRVQTSEWRAILQRLRTHWDKEVSSIPLKMGGSRWNSDRRANRAKRAENTAETSISVRKMKIKLFRVRMVESTRAQPLNPINQQSTFIFWRKAELVYLQSVTVY